MKTLLQTSSAVVTAMVRDMAPGRPFGGARPRTIRAGAGGVKRTGREEDRGVKRTGASSGPGATGNPIRRATAPDGYGMLPSSDLPPVIG